MHQVKNACPGNERDKEKPTLSPKNGQRPVHTFENAIPPTLGS
jgi:hypothetical protein